MSAGQPLLLPADLVIEDHVVLIDAWGQPTSTAAKSALHGPDTPLHLAFSCYLIDAAGNVLITQRALDKRTWPGVWTNSCCGHPTLGESLRATVTRRVREELGLDLTDVSLVVPDFVYRAEMSDGTVEHELCPVLVASCEDAVRPDPTEVADAYWIPWPELVDRALTEPTTLSPWCATQVRRLVELQWTPQRWLLGDRLGISQSGLDRPNDEPMPTRSCRRPGVDALGVVASRIEPILVEQVERRGRAVTAVEGALHDVVEQIRALVLAGGKRLRPAFVYWGHRATGADHADAALHVAAAMELLHTFALLHDDVMDRSATRRGRPTANRALADCHAATGLPGDSAWFGASAAILAGDLTFVWADEVLHDAPLGAAAGQRCRRAFDELRTEVLTGQYLDLRHAADRSVAERTAARVALLKSARYTVSRPLLLGAAIADPATVPKGLDARLTAYGDAVGLAFQLRDDVLGLFGDTSATGKSTLDDLREAKMTLLMVRALALATPAQRVVLEGALGDADLDDAGADAVRDVVAATGALASIEALIASQHLAALEAAASLPDPARIALLELADLAVARRA